MCRELKGDSAMAKEPAENTSEFDLGDFVEGKKFANFEHDFKGIVEKIYEHSLLVLITENDQQWVQRLTNTITVLSFACQKLRFW